MQQPCLTCVTPEGGINDVLRISFSTWMIAILINSVADGKRRKAGSAFVIRLRDARCLHGVFARCSSDDLAGQG